MTGSATGRLQTVLLVLALVAAASALCAPAAAMRVMADGEADAIEVRGLISYKDFQWYTCHYDSGTCCVSNLPDAQAGDWVRYARSVGNEVKNCITKWSYWPPPDACTPITTSCFYCARWKHHANDPYCLLSGSRWSTVWGNKGNYMWGSYSCNNQSLTFDATPCD